MRMEAKNNFVKQITQLGNFIIKNSVFCAYLNSKNIFENMSTLCIEASACKCMNYNFIVLVLFLFDWYMQLCAVKSVLQTIVRGM